MPTAIKKCSCKNAYQDKQYGSQRRVHNLAGANAKGSMGAKFRCTVCGSEKH